MAQPSPFVDEWVAHETRWQAEFRALRALALEGPLTEEVKWGQPCYTWEGKNVFLLHGFKEYCAILFVKGSLMADPEGLLITQTENVQAGRQLRFRSLAEIEALTPVVRAYLAQALEVEKAGLKVPFKKTSEFPVPEEFQSRLQADAALKDAFAALTPGRQRAYLLFFSSAKQAKTREARIDKCVPAILDGLGLDD